MFNPKYNLLEEQLATSGIELNGFFDGVLDFVTGGAHSRNEAAEDAEDAANDYNKKIAHEQNIYFDKLDAAEVANYNAARDHAHQTAVKDWEYGKVIHEYQFNQAVKEYEKSQTISNQQLRLNSAAQRQAISAEQGALNDAFTNFTFAHQNNLSSVQDIFAEQAIKSQSTTLASLGLNLQDASKEVDRLNIGLDSMSKISDRESLGLKVIGTGYDLEQLAISASSKDLELGSLGLDAASKNLDLKKLGLDSASKDLDLKNLGINLASKGLDKKALGFNLLSKQADKQALGFARLSKGLDRQAQNVQLQGIENKQQFGNMSIQNTIGQLLTRNALQKETAMVKSLAALGKAELGQAGKSTAKLQHAVMAELHRGLMSMDIEMSGKHKQAAIQMAELNADASLQKTQVGLNLQRIGLEEAGLDLQGNRIGIEEGLIGLQGQQIGLQQAGIGLQGQQIGLQQAGIGLQGKQIGLQQAGIGIQGQQIGLQKQGLGIQAMRVGLNRGELGIQSDRIGLEEAGLDLQGRRIDIAQASIGIERGYNTLNQIGINNAIDQARRDYQYNSEVLQANMNSSMQASMINLSQINMQKQTADLNTVESRLIEPEMIPYISEPELPPEQEFVKRMKATPGFVPPAQKENLFVAGVNTVSSYASLAMTGVDLYSSIGNLGAAGKAANGAAGKMLS